MASPKLLLLRRLLKFFKPVKSSPCETLTRSCFCSSTRLLEVWNFASVPHLSAPCRSFCSRPLTLGVEGPSAIDYQYVSFIKFPIFFFKTVGYAFVFGFCAVREQVVTWANSYIGWESYLLAKYQYQLKTINLC